MVEANRFKMLGRLKAFRFQRWGGFPDDKEEWSLNEEEVLIS